MRLDQRWAGSEARGTTRLVFLPMNILSLSFRDPEISTKDSRLFGNDFHTTISSRLPGDHGMPHTLLSLVFCPEKSKECSWGDKVNSGIQGAGTSPGPLPSSGSALAILCFQFLQELTSLPPHLMGRLLTLILSSRPQPT